MTERDRTSTPEKEPVKSSCPATKKAPGRNRKIAGQGTGKDTATTLLLKTKNENFAELFNRTLFGNEMIMPDELEEKDIKETALLEITEDGRTALVQYRDVVKGIKDGRTLAVLGVENQSDIDYHMPFRILEVDFVNYARQVRIIEEQHLKMWKDSEGNIHKPKTITPGEYLGRFLKTDKLLPCITLVVYWGETPWDGPKKLSDLFADGPWGAFAWDLKMNILDVCRMTDEEICSYTSELRTVFGFKKYARDKERLSHFINKNQEYFSNVSETALNAMNELTHSPELKGLKKPEYRTQEGGFNVCLGLRGIIEDGIKEGIEERIKEGRKVGIEEGRKVGIEEGRKEGIEEGRKEGVREGRAEQARETARVLRDMGLSIAQIARAVAASQETVEKWLDAGTEKKCNI